MLLFTYSRYNKSFYFVVLLLLNTRKEVMLFLGECLLMGQDWSFAYTELDFHILIIDKYFITTIAIIKCQDIVIEL